MNIIILGAGQVGTTAAYSLAREEANDVTIVDRNLEALRELQERLDVRTVVGNAAFPEVLERAGGQDADMIIALTDSDEINMLACKFASTLFHTPKKIARIRAREYMSRSGLFAADCMAVDVIVSPEALVTKYIGELIQFPGALQVFEFARGRVQLVAAQAHRGGALVGRPVRELPQHIPSVDSRVVAVYRGSKPILPDGDTLIEEGDEVFFISARRDVHKVLSEVRKPDERVRRAVIAGGGNIGVRLARSLEEKPNVHVKLIERGRDRARQISEQLDNTIVLHGDAADEDLLLEENVDGADVFVAVTNAEEANILSAMLAKRLGTRKVMALINKMAYAELVESGSIDIAISPQQVTLGTLLAHVRGGDVVAVHSLRRGTAEAIEAVARGDRNESKMVGRRIGELQLPRDASICAVVRSGEVIMAHHDEVIQTDDHIIMFIGDRRQIDDIERLIRVDAS